MRFAAIWKHFFLPGLVTFSLAQTSVSGTAQCGKPDAQHKVVVPDRPGHLILISQAKCTWNKSYQLAGLQSTGGVLTEMDDILRDAINAQGYFVDTIANGDKVFVHFQGTAVVKDGTSIGGWNYIGGTGRFKDLKGEGTYKGKNDTKGGVSFSFDGHYEFPNK